MSCGLAFEINFWVKETTLEHLIEELPEGLRVEVKVHSPLGLHARPAAKLVQEMQEFTAEVILHHDGQQADAKSILDIMALGAVSGSILHVQAQGPDARPCLMRAAELFASEFKV